MSAEETSRKGKPVKCRLSISEMGKVNKYRKTARTELRLNLFNPKNSAVTAVSRTPPPCLTGVRKVTCRLKGKQIRQDQPLSRFTPGKQKQTPSWATVANSGSWGKKKFFLIPQVQSVKFLNTSLSLTPSALSLVCH